MSNTSCANCEIAEPFTLMRYHLYDRIRPSLPLFYFGDVTSDINPGSILASVATLSSRHGYPLSLFAINVTPSTCYRICMSFVL